MSDNERSHLITSILLFSVFGLMVETLFTGVAAAWAGSFKGGVSLLMIPVYSLSYLLGIFAIPRLQNTVVFNWYLRLPLLVLCIYTIEWIFGAFYKACGLIPWHYEHGWASDFSDGNITLYFLPAWLVFAYLVIPVIKVIQNVSPVLYRQITEQFSSGSNP